MIQVVIRRQGKNRPAHGRYSAAWWLSAERGGHFARKNLLLEGNGWIFYDHEWMNLPDHDVERVRARFRNAAGDLNYFDFAWRVYSDAELVFEHYP